MEELLFNSAEDVKDYLKTNFEVGDVIKVANGNGEKLIGIILEDFSLRVIWDDYSINNDRKSGLFTSWIWDFEDIDEDSTYFIIEMVA